MTSYTATIFLLKTLVPDGTDSGKESMFMTGKPTGLNPQTVCGKRKMNN